jgi:hypothetical protein
MYFFVNALTGNIFLILVISIDIIFLTEKSVARRALIAIFLMRLPCPSFGNER